mmetsp:Transcript_5133/g.12617  ORF Transcript_5133/g.12617 Transcript_5133/m.12617 type:complete len:91 (+) Transcript_5133:51-323(+)
MLRKGYAQHKLGIKCDRLRIVNIDYWYFTVRCVVRAYDYVPSASNIADLPTRLDASAFSRLEAIARRIPLRLPPEWCLACGHSDLAQLFE